MGLLVIWGFFYLLGAVYWLAAAGQQWADAPRGSAPAREAGRRMLVTPIWPYAALWLVTREGL